jgi:hypothetical protein
MEYLLARFMLAGAISFFTFSYFPHCNLILLCNNAPAMDNATNDTEPHTAACEAALSASEKKSTTWKKRNRNNNTKYQREYRARKKILRDIASGKTPAPTTDIKTFNDICSSVSYIHARLSAATEAITRIASRIDSLHSTIHKLSSELSTEPKTPKQHQPPTTKPKPKMFK